MTRRADVTGMAGAVPPPHAPRQVSQPLSPDVIESQLAAARANERPLPPFDPPRRSPNTAPTLTDAPPSIQSLVDDVFGEVSSAAPAIILTDAEPIPVAAAPAMPTMPYVPPVPVDEPYRPAASNTDTPSRGIPRMVDDPGKIITGGFGEALDAQYFGLDGTEVRELVFSKMDLIADRLKNDIRFSIAAVYPRITVRVKIEVEAYGLDVPLSIQQEIVHAKTPIEVALAKGAERRDFTVTEEVGEMTADGQHDKAPNEIRQELDLPIPRKQSVESGAGRLIVDVLT